MPGHPLVEQALATLCRLADAPPAADAARSAIAEIEAAWAQPFAVGVGGPLPARTELFNFVCAGKVFDPHARPPGSATVRLRRGPVTGFRATRQDGTHEEQTQPPDRTKDIVAARARATAARGELAEREGAIERVDSTLPKRPPWWALWMWPVYGVLVWIGRRKRLARTQLAQLALGEARQQLETIEQDAAALEAHTRLAKTRYFESLKNLASGGAIGAGVVEVEVTLASSPLPEGLELVELAGASRAGLDVDAVVVAEGELAPLVAGLPALAADARGWRLARRVQAKIGAAITSLHDAIERKELTFRARVDRLAALRLADPVAFANAQLERVRGDISASVNAVVEHSSVHLGSELAQLQEQWIGAIAGAGDGDALKAAVARVDEEWHARPRRIADEVRVLVMGGLGGSARDLYPTVVTPLLEHGLPEEHTRPRAAPELPAVTLLPSLAKDGAKLERSSWFAGLFRSFEARRAEIREKVHERVEHMREVAEAELLDAEPRLHHAIGTALANLLEAAIGKQQEWLDQALDDERAAIATDREVILPLIRVYDAVRDDAKRLAQLLDQLERHQPTVATAAAAAETASLSR